MRHTDTDRFASGGGLRQRLSAASKTFLIAAVTGVMLGAAVMGAPTPALASPTSSPSEIPVPSSVASRSGILHFTVSNGKEDTTSFVYGDEIQIEGTSILGSSSSAALFYMNKQLTDWAPFTETEAGNRSSFSIAYDTTKKGISVGEGRYLEIRVMGSSGNIEHGQGLSISLSKKSLDDEYDVTVSLDPSIQNTLLVDSDIFRSEHAWDDSLKVEWFSDGQPAKGVIASSHGYMPVTKDIGAMLTAKVSLNNDWYTFSKTSKPFVFDGFENPVELTPDFLSRTYSVDYQKEVVASGEIEMPDGSPDGPTMRFELTSDPQGGEVATELTAVPGETFYVRVPAFEVYKPSSWMAVTLPKRSAAPVEGTDFTLKQPASCADTQGTIMRAVGADLEYRRGEEGAWSALGAEMLTVDAGEKVQLRLPPTGNEFASEVVTVEFDVPTHAPSSDWESDADSHWHACGNDCGTRLDEAEHSFEWIIDKPATEDAAGSRHEKCTVCGYEAPAVEIPPTGGTVDPDGPDDPSNVSKPDGATGSAGTDDADGSANASGRRDPALPATGDPVSIVSAAAALGSAAAAAGLAQRRRA